MKLSSICESKQEIRLFHGAPLDALDSILKHGLDTSLNRFPAYTENPKVFFSFEPSEAQPAKAEKGYILVEVVTDERNMHLGLGWAKEWQKLMRLGFDSPELNYLHPAAKEKLKNIAAKIRDGGMDWAPKLTDSEKEFLFRVEAQHSKRSGEFQKREKALMGAPEAFIGRRVGFKGRTRIAAMYLVNNDGTISRIIYKTASPTLQAGDKIGKIE